MLWQAFWGLHLGGVTSWTNMKIWLNKNRKGPLQAAWIILSPLSSPSLRSSSVKISERKTGGKKLTQQFWKGSDFMQRVFAIKCFLHSTQKMEFWENKACNFREIDPGQNNSLQKKRENWWQKIMEPGKQSTAAGSTAHCATLSMARTLSGTGMRWSWEMFRLSSNRSLGLWPRSWCKEKKLGTNKVFRFETFNFLF